MDWEGIGREIFQENIVRFAKRERGVLRINSVERKWYLLWYNKCRI